jgi:site-specific DNA-methyltransferase (adenine-specific)
VSKPVVIGDATLYMGDCMSVMLPTVSHVITDPPYEAGAHTKGRRLLGEQTDGTRTVEYGALDFDCMTDDLRRAISFVCAEKCEGWMLAFCQAEAVSQWREAHIAAGAKYKRAMVWIKPDGAPQFTGDRPGMGYESIVASWCGTGRSVWNGGGRHGVFIHPQRDNNSPKDHMTQKPVGLMLDLVRLFTTAGDTILDPFMGSGTTGVAAIQQGRKFVGVEKEPRHFATACRRIESAYAQRPLFPAEPQRKPEQLGLEA